MRVVSRSLTLISIQCICNYDCQSLFCFVTRLPQTIFSFVGMNESDVGFFKSQRPTSPLLQFEDGLLVLIGAY